MTTAPKRATRSPAGTAVPYRPLSMGGQSEVKVPRRPPSALGRQGGLSAHTDVAVGTAVQPEYSLRPELTEVVVAADQKDGRGDILGQGRGRISLGVELRGKSGLSNAESPASGQ